MLNALNQLQTALNTTHQLSGQLVIAPDSPLNPTASALAALAHTQLSSLASQIDAMNLGDDLQMLGPTVKALDNVVASLTLPYIGSAPLYLSLAMSNPQDVPGSSLTTLLKLIGNGIEQSALNNPSAAAKAFFNNLLYAAILSLLGTNGEIAKQSSGSYPTLDAGDLSIATSFASELLLTAAASSGMLEQMFKEAVAVSGGNDQAQQLGELLCPPLLIC